MLKKGRVCYKVAGRDPGVCVVLEEKEGRYLVVGPNVRKRWVNPAHLEPLPEVVDVKDEKKMMKELEKIEKRVKEAREDKLKIIALKAMKKG